MTMHTCRFCGVIEHGVREARMVRYGRRHWAHATCYLDRRGIAGLSRSQLASMPYRALKERGLLDEVEHLFPSEGRYPLLPIFGTKSDLEG